MSSSYTRLNHIIWAIDSIQEFGPLDLTDKKTFAAVVYFLQIIGEASKKVAPDVKALTPDVPWKKMMALRNYVAHEYFALDIEAIHKALVTLPQIKTHLQNIKAR